MSKGMAKKKIITEIIKLKKIKGFRMKGNIPC